jgi:metal-responsive CopG/Arc/MetJ family transcriptional regulator
MSKINLNINDDLLNSLDAASDKSGINRSEFIREAVVNFISQKQEEEKKMLKKKKIEDAMQFFDKMSRKNKDWDGVEEINRLRQSRKV